MELQTEFTSFEYRSSYIEDEELEDLHAVAEEFGEYVREVRMLIERSKVLNDMAKSTARLVRFR